jgi:hypothetical protein
MAPSIHVTNPEAPGARTLADASKRAFTFLRTLGTNTAIRALMNEHGYTQDDHLEGWRLLFAASGSGSDSLVKAPAAIAIRELDAWDEAGFHKAHAALGRRFPDQAAFVFEDLAPTQGPTAVIGVKKFLDRLDALEKGDGRDATRTVDLEAIAALAKRGFDQAERARLRALVETAQTDPAAAKAPLPTPSREEDQLALYAWYQEWVEVARAVVTLRSDRILLGIARRKTRAEGDDEVPETDKEPSAAAPTPTDVAPADATRVA